MTCTKDTRSICEPTGALSLAGAKKYLASHPNVKGAHVAIISGANVNFDRLRFISERAELGEQTEAFCNVIIPERKGSFMTMIEQVLPRAVTEFSYRYSDPEKAHIYISFKVQNLATEVADVLEKWRTKGMEGWDVSHNELAKTHARYMMGGRGRPEHERVFRFGNVSKDRVLNLGWDYSLWMIVFPERPGALMRFLEGLNSTWNVSLFNYRNHGDGKHEYDQDDMHAHMLIVNVDMGKVLVGIQVPPEDNDAFASFLEKLNYYYVEETDNVVYKTFLQ